MNKQYLAYQQQLISSFDEQGIVANNINFHDKKMVARVPKNISVVEQVKYENNQH